MSVQSDRTLSERASALRWACAVLWILSGVAILRAADERTAERALEEGIPQVAIAELRALLAAEPSPEMRMKSSVLLARAYLEADRSADAVALLRSLPKTEDPALAFWLAQAMLSDGKPGEARSLFEKLALRDDPIWSDRARMGLATCLRELGHPAEALAALEPLPKTSPAASAARLLAAELALALGMPDRAEEALAGLDESEDREAALAGLLRARLAVARGDDAGAAVQFQQLARSEAGDDPGIAAAAAQSGAEVLLRLGDDAAAEQLLEGLIQASPDGETLVDAFRTLDQVYARQVDPSTSELKKWASDADPAKAALAEFFRARVEDRVGRHDRAVDMYSDFLRDHPAHPLAPEARLALARSLLRRDQPREALAALAKPLQTEGSREVQAATIHAAGEAMAADGQYGDAAREFRRAAEIDPRLQSTALENARRAAMRDPGFLKDFRPTEDLSFGVAMELARHRHPDAPKTLGRFADGDDKDLSVRARLALSELALERGDRESARSQLVKIADAGSDLSERAAFLDILLSDEGTETSDLVVEEKIRAYLAVRPGMEHEAEARFKWGEVLFRRGEYRAARLQFSEASTRARNPALREQALFFAAMSAARSISRESLLESLDLYEAVIALNGPLAPEARLEEAVVKNALGQPDDALVIIEKVIRDSASGGVRFRAMSEKGDTLVSIAGGKPEKLRAAAGVFDALASDPSASLRWRNEGRCKMGLVLEKIGDHDAALAAFYKVLDTPQTDEPEFFWYYKAGFEAGRMLEEQKLWKEAIAVYGKMAKLQGPRSDEAKARVNRLRLENFLWNDE